MRETRSAVFLDAEGGVWIADEYGRLLSAFIALRRRDPDEIAVLADEHKGDFPPVTYWGPCPRNATEMDALGKAIESKKAAPVAA